jgi:hypothetical protein
MTALGYHCAGCGTPLTTEHTWSIMRELGDRTQVVIRFSCSCYPQGALGVALFEFLPACVAALVPGKGAAASRLPWYNSSPRYLVNEEDPELRKFLWTLENDCDSVADFLGHAPLLGG